MNFESSHYNIGRMWKIGLKKWILLYVIILMLASNSVQYDFVVIKTNANTNFKIPIVKRNVMQDAPLIKEFLVTTNVANRFAETMITSKVENRDSYAKQTAFSVVLPERAFISGFNMEIDDHQYTAFVKEKQEARQLFGQSISTGQTAGHIAVSTRYSNRFTINVNIEPYSKVIFHLKYEELLQRKDGQYEIITNIQPGQIVKKLKVEVYINESRPLSFVRTPLLRSGSNSLLQYNANLDPHANVHWLNNSAWIVFEPDVERQLEFACAGLGNREFDGFAGQFVVKYDVNRTGAPGETIYQDGILLSFFAPSPKSFDPLPKHIVFVLDTSGSMDGQKINQLIDAMLKIMPQLNDEDIFSIVQYASTVYVWDLYSTANDIFSGKDPEFLPYGNLADELQNTYIPPAYPASEENINKVQALLRQLTANDLTNSIGALEIGLLLINKAQMHYPEKYQPILVFLTDGLPNVGSSSPEEIIEKTIRLNTASYNTPIYSLCFGDDADWEFLKYLSLKSQGKPTKIPVAGDSSNLLQDFYKTISTPLLKDLAVKSPEAAESTQTNFLIFFNGTELVFAAKEYRVLQCPKFNEARNHLIQEIGNLSQTAVSLVLENLYLRPEYVEFLARVEKYMLELRTLGVSENDAQPISVSAKSKQGPVNLESQLGIPLTKLEKVYAYLMVKQLADQYQATGNTSLSKLALNLALNYSLVSDFTSLVVVRPDSEGAVDTTDGSIGIFPEEPNELPLCQNITDWIIQNFGTTEPDVTDFTTELISTDVTTELTTTEEQSGVYINEANLPLIMTTATTTVTPTTTSPTTTTERIVTCKESTYGCCYDGVTFSPGPNADGCDPIPKSESCSLPADKGPCKNVTFKWFYSTIKHQCRVLRYGGCGGNDNRFPTKSVCENTCISPHGDEVCKLPISLGLCNKKILYWFYDKSTDECVKFLHGGCHGNGNKFSSKQTCLRLCSPQKLQDTIKDTCYQPKDKGRAHCRRFEVNYHFDSSIGQCIKFWFTGCGGNDNRFTSKDVCEKMCIYSKNRAVCNAPPQKGPCQESHPAYYYDPRTSACKQFIYGGCGGNRNKFYNKKECEDFCQGVRN